MRPTEDHPRQPRRRRRLSGRGRVIVVAVVVILLILVLSLRGLAGFYTDYLWFRSLHLTGVWSGVLGAKWALGAIFTVIFFGLLWSNLFIADKLAPVFPPGPEDDLVERYREVIGRRTALVRVIVSAVFALIAGAGVSSQWKDWILFTHPQKFGTKDATFHVDIGFYVFRLPFLTFLGSWLFAAFVIVLIVTTVAHYLNGGIRIQTPGPHVTPQVKAHLSVLLGVLALIKGYQYLLQRYSLVFSHRGTVDGALYTDVRVEMKALYLLMMISVFALALFIVNIWRRGWVLPVLAVGLWGFVAVLAGAIVPAFVQRFRVQPAESRMERPYIQHNIDATRAALGLNKVDVRNFDLSGNLTSTGLTQNAATVRNIRLWDPLILKTVFQKTQALRAFYEINNVGVDRYNLNGEITQAMVANRDLDTGNVPQQSWEATHLAYTHGYGMVMAAANATNSGQPRFSLADIPTTVRDGAPQVKQPAVYFGGNLSGYVMVNTGRSEIDYTNDSGQAISTHYEGRDGIKVGGGLGGFVNRTAFALRFGDINPLISSNVRANSKILINRDVTARLRAVAPFISWDSDPYTVALRNGRLVYIADGYTTTNRYPNAQRANTSDVPAGSGIGGTFNYVRNSVKAVVDAYDGTVTLYVVDPSDPLIKAYRSAFPELFKPLSKASADLRSHFRYPEDLFRVQTQMWSRYHQTSADTFYNNQEGWNVALDPNAVAGSIRTVVTASGQRVNLQSPMDPYYLLMKLPGQSNVSFMQLRPFVPVQAPTNARQQLEAFMVAQSDPNDYGHLLVYQMPSGNLPQAPANVAAQMQQDANVSSQQTLLCKSGGGSTCEFGNVVLVPIDGTLIYVRPLYVQSEQNQLPELQRVVVAYQDESGSTQVAIDPTLYGALSRLFCPVNGQTATPAALSPANAAPSCNIPATRESGAPTTGAATATPATPSAPTPPQAAPGAGSLASSAAQQQVRSLTQQLNAAVNQAKTDASTGNFSGFGDELNTIQTLSQQLSALVGSSASSPPPTTAPPTTAPRAPTTRGPTGGPAASGAPSSSVPDRRPPPADRPTTTTSTTATS